MKIETKTLDSRDYCEKLIVPMVIRHRKIANKMVYTGFVPGFEGKDVIGENMEECKTRLFERTKKVLIEMLKNDKPFPFFPTKEELMEDYKDIVNITFTSVPNTKK